MSGSWAIAGVDLHLDLDPSAGRRGGLERALREAIGAGRLAPGTRLPATRRLAVELGMARNTVAAAYDQLVAEGYLTARRGAGTVVAPLPRAVPAGSAGAARPPAPRHDLRPGRPDTSAFPTAAWLRATRRALAVPPARALDYGDPRGRVELRTALAGYLGRTRGVRVAPEHVVVTSGYVQALSLLASVVAGPVAMEDPGFAFHREVVRRAGRRVVPLPVDELGAGVPPEWVAAAVVTPAHQYPTGVPLHPSRRHALTAWARETGGLLVEDDYDGEFRYDRQPLGAVQGTAPDQVAYAGSASKTLGPGVRLGWLVLPPRWVDAVVDAKLHADHHTEVVGQLALAELIGSHAYDRHVRGARLRYRRRRDLLLRRLGGFTPRGVSAGLHVLVEVPDEEEVLARAARRGVALSGLRECRHAPDPAARQGVVVGYGSPAEHAYRAAVEALAEVLGG